MTQSHKRLLHVGLEHYDHVDLDAGAVFFADALRRQNCPCCGIRMLVFGHELPTASMKPGSIQFQWLKLKICPECGWWNFQRDLAADVSSAPQRIVRATWWELTHAVQAEIDLGSHTLPIELLRQHLLRHWEDRKLISAQQAEELVGSLLQEHHGGRVIRMTANANAADGGIDLYLSARDDGTIQRAIQVKRRIIKDVEGVREVRNFIGSMVLAGVKQGIFVTTASRFSREARSVPNNARRTKFKLGLELIDGERLLELIRATIASQPVQLPPQVQFEQEWRDSGGRIVLARDLFTGDMSGWRSWVAGTRR